MDSNTREGYLRANLDEDLEDPEKSGIRVSRSYLSVMPYSTPTMSIPSCCSPPKPLVGKVGVMCQNLQAPVLRWQYLLLEHQSLTMYLRPVAVSAPVASRLRNLDSHIVRQASRCLI